DHRKTLDFEAIEAERATAAERSAFDASKEAILARRYEAAAAREVYKALAEFRRVEAEAAERAQVEPEQEEAEVPGSFGAQEDEKTSPVSDGRPAGISVEFPRGHR